MDVRLNHQGGVIPENAAERARAAAVDLGTLPESLSGTSCGTCQFFELRSTGIGYCTHRQIQQLVTVRQCCCLWNAPGWLRAAHTR